MACVLDGFGGPQRWGERKFGGVGVGEGDFRESLVLSDCKCGDLKLIGKLESEEGKWNLGFRQYFGKTYFKRQKPVLQLVPRIRQLEDEIDKVTIMSMHKSRIPNSTYVVFGFLLQLKDISIHPVSLSVLKSSLLSLFLQESNLILTSSTFGVPTSFEIVKFRGGVTVIPRQPAPVSQIVQTLSSFTLNNSIYDVKENLDLLTKQLKTGLHLNFNENVYVQVTNKAGSTFRATQGDSRENDEESTKKGEHKIL